MNNCFHKEIYIITKKTQMSEIINKNKYLDFEGLKKYDVLIKGLIASGDTELANAIAALDEKIGSINVDGSDGKNIAETIDGIYSSIADIVASQTALEKKDEELAVQIKKISDDLQFVTGGDSENEATIGEINAKILRLNEELNALKVSVNNAASKSDVEKNSAAIEVLNGDGEGSVKKIAEDAAATAVANVVAGAESDFDTLKEVADWIAADKEGSAALQTTVSNHTESINTINSNLGALESKVDGDIANLTSHISEASVALSEVDGRLNALEAFEETHEPIQVADIERLFA